ncbi:MAG: peptidoglycan-binding domain-containing protein, partial [Patescibacteria group bacterium]|nr:peptidoglycan-binding domain-containing protein [Patescibacteria group bacterium]
GLKDSFFYYGPINGIYDSQTARAVAQFQRNQGLITSYLQSNAGHFDNVTRDQFNLYHGLVGNPLSVTKETITPEVEEMAEEVIIEDTVNQAVEEIEAVEESITETITTRIMDGFDPISGLYTIGDTGTEIITLQTGLKDANFYFGEITGIYDSPTAIAVARFQKNQSIIYSFKQPHAGHFGQDTRDSFNWYHGLGSVDTEVEEVIIEDTGPDTSIENNLLTHILTRQESIQLIEYLRNK